jgi:hypothetical protein
MRAAFLRLQIQEGGAMRKVSLAWLATFACASAGTVQAETPPGLVYTALPPCRILDTRPSQGGTGAMAANETRTFHVVGSTSNFAGQGGLAGGCGIPGYADTIPQVQAVMFNFVAVSAAGAGNLRAWATDQPMPSAATLNYAKVTDQTTGFAFNIANGIAIPVSQDGTEGADISIRASNSGTDVVADVVGYFSRSFQPVQSEGVFIQGNGAEVSQCAQWNNFRASLAGNTFSRITLLGSAGGPFSCSDDAAVASIVDALVNRTNPFTVSCDGRDWNVGGCGNDPFTGGFQDAVEINSRTSGAGDCACDSAATLRPCIDVNAFNNPNWGGLGGTTCGAAGQNIILRLER